MPDNGKVIKLSSVKYHRNHDKWNKIRADVLGNGVYEPPSLLPPIQKPFPRFGARVPPIDDNRVVWIGESNPGSFFVRFRGEVLVADPMKGLLRPTLNGLVPVPFH